ncbi:TlpA disulfide reductase family protein [Nocardioides sp.]|uniref:TlpA disulfide reductase family protein n=1 Tax=Nocardioides sp. TaxID=35761 RepID=UPI002ED01D3C
MSRAVAVALTVLLAGVGTLVACAGEQDPGLMPGPAEIDVDTAELRRLKADLGVEDCPEVEPQPVADGLPDVTLPCLGGGSDVPISGLRGPLVVNLWASWCGPCRTEMPVLQKFHERYADQVGIVGVDYEDPQVAGAFDLVRASGVTYPLLADPQASLQGADPFPGRMGLPIFAFVDEQGRATVVAGGVDSVRELVDLVDVHLGVEL